MIRILQTLTRLLAFVSKELIEVIRRPGAIVSLILGPFLIMSVFGLGYNGFRRPLETVIVIPPQSGLPTDLGTYQSVAIGMEIREIAPEPGGPLQRLRNRELDAVIVAPADLEERFRAGELDENLFSLLTRNVRRPASVPPTRYQTCALATRPTP